MGGPQILWCQEYAFADGVIRRGDLDLEDPSLLDNILGVRADVEVPLRYLAFFEYRWNFLILARRDKIPRPLRKFLLGLWKTKRYSLWLHRPTSLISFAKHRALQGCL